MEGYFPASRDDLQEEKRRRDGAAPGRICLRRDIAGIPLYTSRREKSEEKKNPAEPGTRHGAGGKLIAWWAGVCYAARESSPVEGMSMAFCKACGQEIGTATFCPKCGANQGASATPVASGAAAPAASPTEGIQENVAGLLCYVLGWLSGIIFLLIDKRPWVKFHAAQSIVVFGGLTVIRIGLMFLSGVLGGGVVGWGVLGLLGLAIGLVGLVLWILLMVKAYQHQTFRVPIAADIADGMAK
jgi:uncharacterized membrane protein